MKQARVVVVGSSNTDMVVKAKRIPSPGETLLGGEFVMTAGGKGANQAVAAARLGAEVYFVGCVGKDIFGDKAHSDISSMGVNCHYMLRSEQSPSGVALICVDENGQNSIVVAPGANSCITPDDIIALEPLFQLADMVVIQLEIPLETVQAVISLTRSINKPLIVNPAPAPSTPLDLQGVEYITPNEHEAQALLGIGTFQAEECARLLIERLGVKTAIITLGAEGVVVGTQGKTYRIPAFPVHSIDTTAAGDCFTGALACALGEGQSLKDALRFANSAASISVTRFGAQASMPSREEVLKQLPSSAS